MRFIGVVLLFSWALGQSLVVPPQGQVNKSLEIIGSEFQSGRISLQISGPNTSQALEVEAVNGSFQTRYTPIKPGMYTFVVGKVQSQTQVVAQPQSTPPATIQPSATPSPAPSTNTPTPPASTNAPTPAGSTVSKPAKPAPLPQPQLSADGLVVGGWRLPLTGSWIGPRTVKGHTYIAQGPLLLEVDLAKPAVVAHHYPPAEVRSIETEPDLAVVLVDGRRLLLNALSGHPYEGKWNSLEVFTSYRQTLEKSNALPMDQSSSQGRPYWYYFAQDPNQLTAADLEATGRDLLQRGHRPELTWGSGVLRWLEPWLRQIGVARAKGIDGALMWSEFFLKYMPQLPGAQRVFTDQIAWLEAQGRPDLAQRYREGLRQMRAWNNPLSASNLSKIAFILLGLYALMALYLNLAYLPAQLRGTAVAGGWLLGWFRHPLVRLRHTLLAYTTVGERLLIIGLFVTVSVALLAWGFALRSENLVSQDNLTRGTLRSSAVQEFLRTTANSGAMRGLLGYALAKDDPTEAQRLLADAPPWTYVLLNRGTPDALARAARQAPGSAAVKDALGTGGDLWTSVYRDAQVAREGVPTPRILSATVLLSGLQALKSDFLGVWRTLPIWPSELWAWGIAILMLLLTIYHVLCFFIPRPKDAINNSRWKRGVQFFFPGSPSYSQGWGLLVLLGLVAGILLWRDGNTGGIWLVLVAVVAHLTLWGLGFFRPRTA